MHNSVAYIIAMLAFCGIATAVLAWSLLSGLRAGRLSLRFGGMVRRREQPVGFWLLAGAMTMLLTASCIGLGAFAVDLAFR